MKTCDPRVSDHAVLRYLERVKGFDIEAVRREILSPNVQAAVAMGARAVEIGSYKLIIVNGTITTCVERSAHCYQPNTRRVPA